MRTLPKALIAAAAVFAAAQQIALAKPAAPDFGQYAQESADDYTLCSGADHGPKHCVVAFKSSDDTSGYLCYMIPSTTSARCVNITGPTVEGRVQSTGSSQVSNSSAERDGTAEAVQELQPLHKLVIEGSPENHLACGAGEDGSVACQNATGHGFVLSHDSARTW
ncbi:hypothetical protein Srot_1894 [Segniliparus rotundus DSM 44985]|uniref:Uncharacterized protein n=1 Tax=Segniliparus rotundus (strain ATCC BAA-972 / CDC 1076 / CIP 108378 / DSM 44985 / JCM 13578) TaxID=640132 RepID=D6Z8S4_SEGRD|nr:hypothetical protein [Segniliparus rotundus]ADG98354.1 hypothetical protein Srot_1894 [Segniliparus rotundus DSM 44985]